MTERPERWDLLTLGLSVVLVPAVWLIALGWSPDDSVGQHDQVAQGVPLLADFLHNAHGDFALRSYRAELLGGAKIHDVIGTLPIYQVFAWLGASTLTALNGALFFTQVAYAFFGVRLAYDVARLMSGGRLLPRWLPVCGVILLTAFSPAVAWKITVGHHEQVLGALLGISLVALFLAHKNGTSSLTLVGMTIAVDLNAFQTKGQELLYSAVFFGLVIVAVALPIRPARKLLVPALVVAGSFALSLPKLAGMVAHAASSDATRGLGSGSVIYSYITATLHDWVASIPWGMEIIPSGRDPSFWHEINFGFGPPLVLLVLLPWKRERLLAAGLAVSFVLPVLFSMDVAPVPWVLTHLCPLLEAYRVPERAILSFALVLPAFASAALLLWPSPAPLPRWVMSAMVVAGGIVLFVAPRGLREVLAWSLPLAIVLRPVFRWPWTDQIPATALLVVLGIGSVSAFKERLRPFSTAESLFDNPEKLGDQIRATQPELRSSLTRIVVHFDLDGFQPNTAFAMGLSSLSGYLNPPRRFLALEAALAGTEENLLRNYFRLDETAPSFAALQPLYNVKYGAFPEGKRLRLSPVGDTAGPAWFSASLTRVGTLTELATAVHTAGPGLAAEAHRQAWIVTSDRAVTAASLPDVVSPECARASVTNVEAAIGSQRFRLGVDSPAACPLTVAENFASDLTAAADGQPVTLFPAYGALTGVWVPAGAHEVVIEARAIIPWWSRAAWVLGLGLLGLAFVEMWRLRRREALAPPGE